MLNRRGFISGAATSVGALAAVSCATPDAAAQPSPVSFNVVYPNHEGARFDLAYYQATHIPMLMRAMSPSAIQLIEGVPRGDAAPPFVMILHVQFASQAALDAALANPGMAELRADVANFTDIRPAIMFGRTPA